MAKGKHYVSVESIVAILEQIAPGLDPAKLIKDWGDHRVFFSDDSESPELYVEYNLLENTPDYIHPMFSFFTNSSSPNRAAAGFDPILPKGDVSPPG